MPFDLEIVTPREVLARTTADEIIIPAQWGQMDIFPQHTDYVTTLVEGDLVYRSGGERRSHRITGGLITVSGDKVKVLADGVLADVVDIHSARQGHH